MSGTRLTVVDSGFDNIPADRRENLFELDPSAIEAARVYLDGFPGGGTTRWRGSGPL